MDSPMVWQSQIWSHHDRADERNVATGRAQTFVPDRKEPADRVHAPFSAGESEKNSTLCQRYLAGILRRGKLYLVL